MKKLLLFSAVFIASLGGIAAHAEGVDPLSTLEWRAIGPARGGRVQTVTGVVGDRDTYYMGATGGGVWKTTDGGERWTNISDDFFKTGSVGSIAVAPSDPNVIYVGMGEADVRGNFSHGDGVYRSRDAGKTWEHVGLDDTGQIGRVIVHPSDPDTVYVAAARARVRPERGAGCVPLDGRRGDVGQDQVRQRPHRRGAHRDGPQQPARAVREFLAREPDAVEFGERRRGQRAVPLARWGRHVGDVDR